MEYRRFIAPTRAVARKQLFRELGTNAYIVEEKVVTKRSFFGISKKTHYEITAGRPTKTPADIRTIKPYLKNRSFLEEAVKSDKSLGTITTKKSKKNPERQKKVSNLIDLIKEKSNTKQQLILDTEHSQAKDNSLDFQKEGFATKNNTLFVNNNPLNKSLKLMNFLEEKEFDKDFSQLIYSKFKQDWQGTIKDKSYLSRLISEQFSFNSEINTYSTTPNIILLIGSTGIGKTTTLAKILAEQGNLNRKIAILTFDNIRIGAPIHIKEFAHILGFPCQVIKSEADLKKHFSQYMKYDCIFIDTAGTTLYNQNYNNELQKLLEGILLPKDIHLCLNATLRVKEMKKVVEQFMKFKNNKVIITKVDESDSMGPVLSVLHHYNLNISYITNGQDVPGDIFNGNVDNVAKYLMQEWA